MNNVTCFLNIWLYLFLLLLSAFSFYSFGNFSTFFKHKNCSSKRIFQRNFQKFSGFPSSRWWKCSWCVPDAWYRVFISPFQRHASLFFFKRECTFWTVETDLPRREKEANADRWLHEASMSPVHSSNRGHCAHLDWTECLKVILFLVLTRIKIK